MNQITSGLIVGAFLAAAFTIDHYLLHGAKHAPLSNLKPEFWLAAAGGFLAGKYIIEPIITPFLKGS